MSVEIDLKNKRELLNSLEMEITSIQKALDNERVRGVFNFEEKFSFEK